MLEEKQKESATSASQSHNSTAQIRVPMAQVRLDSKTIRAAGEVLRSGNLRAGPLTEEFEKRFAEQTGSRFAIAVSSGTAALHIAYSGMLKPGDEVIVPDFTFVATASMVLAAGAKPVLADVSPRTFTLDPADVERRITRRTRALAPVHLYGHPAAIRQLADLAKRHHLQVIWDAAQAHGAQYQRKDVGSFADAVCYSFYPSKNMTTGEGGMITTRNVDLAERFRLLRSHGEKGRYNHVCLGYNYRMTDIAAAIGLNQLRSLPEAVERRRRNAAAMVEGLSEIDGILLPSEDEACTHSYHLFTIRLQPEILGMTREEFRQSLAVRGVETAVHYPQPLHRQPLFYGLGSDADFPSSSCLAESVLSLPVHPRLTARQIAQVIQAVREAARQRRSGRSTTSKNPRRVRTHREQQ
jgi:perosamine synthetase